MNSSHRGWIEESLGDGRKGRQGEWSNRSLWGTMDDLSAGTYTLEVDAPDQNLSTQITYTGKLALPVVPSSSMQFSFNSNGDLVLNWQNPTSDANWSDVTSLEMHLDDQNGIVRLNVFLNLSQETATIPKALLDEAAALVPGGLTKWLWRVQTDAKDPNNMDYARGGSNWVSIPAQALSVSGWWDLFVPSVETDKKVDAVYLTQNNSSIVGKNILSRAITGTIDGTSIQLFFTDYNVNSFIGSLSGDTISGNFDQATPGYLKRSTFHFTNFTPGDELPSLTPSFEWTPAPGADSYLISVSLENSQENRGDTGSCVGVWELGNITQTKITFNCDGNANQSLIPGNVYRVHVNAYSKGSIIDKTLDVYFIVSD